MKTSLFVGMALIATGCATVTPGELTTARASYARASSGPAVQLLPAELHKAKVVLDAAETSFVEEKASQKTIDLAYIADRTIQTVEAQAQTALAEQTISKAKQDYQDKQGQVVKKTQASLVKTRLQLTDAQRGQAQESGAGGRRARGARGGRHEGRRVRAAGAGLRAKDHRSERRAGQVGGER